MWSEWNWYLIGALCTHCKQQTNKPATITIIITKNKKGIVYIVSVILQ